MLKQKSISKAFADKIEEALLSTIFQNRTAYVKNCCMSESGRQIADILDVCNKEKIPGNHGC